MKTPFALIIGMIFLSVVKADVPRFSFVDTDALTIKSPDGSSTLHIELERIKREEIKTVKNGDQYTAWHGKRQLPFGVFLTPTLIKKFDLTIDGKKVNIPKNFWDDIGGLPLLKMTVDPKRPIVTDLDKAKAENYRSRPRRGYPTISRTPGGSTVLISWIRPEE